MVSVTLPGLILDRAVHGNNGCYGSGRILSSNLVEEQSLDSIRSRSIWTLESLRKWWFACPLSTVQTPFLNFPRFISKHLPNHNLCRWLWSSPCGNAITMHVVMNHRLPYGDEALRSITLSLCRRDFLCSRMTIKCLESDVTLMNGRTWTQKNKAKDHHPDGIFSAPKVSFPSITQREFQKAAASSSSDSRHRMVSDGILLAHYRSTRAAP